MKFDVLVVGGGVNGLSTAYHLSKKAGLKIGLVEQFSLGHAHGSSHGFSRIFRSTYANPVYGKLAKRAQVEAWPLLEEEVGHRLIHPNLRCVFGEGPSFEAYAKTILGDRVEALEMSAARRLFPQFRFPNSFTVLQDHSSELIAARDVMENLEKLIACNGVEILQETRVVRIDQAPSSIRLETTKGPLFTERLVVAAGPWILRLIPEIAVPFYPVRQVIAYFKLRGAKEFYQLGRFPNWVHFGENEVFYGLPEFGCEGIKVAQDITSGEIDDPDERSIDPRKVNALENFVSEHFAQPVDRLVGVETCIYTNTKTGDFVLDLFPADPRIVIGAACSGHAFKFAPLTGRILAELALSGKTTIAEFEENRELFSIAKAKSSYPQQEQ